MTKPMHLTIRLLSEAARTKEQAAKSWSAREMGPETVKRLVDEADELRRAIKILQDHEDNKSDRN